jgi:hypothetical protein
MGFGFNIFFAGLLLPLTVIMALIWLFTQSKTIGRALKIIGLTVGGLATLITISNLIFDKKEISHDDIFGEYVIDRSQFPGKQADWQYNHFRFVITRQQRLLFHCTEGERIIKTYTGRIKFLQEYKLPRTIWRADSPSYHIIRHTPTLYRTPFSFYYVFDSTRFGNVFFTKGKWKPINE